jgi:hypothetical protein
LRLPGGQVSRPRMEWARPRRVSVGPDADARVLPRQPEQRHRFTRRGAVGRVRVMDAATDDRSARADGTRAAGVGVGGNELREAVEDYAC